MKDSIETSDLEFFKFRWSRRNVGDSGLPVQGKAYVQLITVMFWCESHFTTAVNPVFYRKIITAWEISGKECDGKGSGQSC